MEENLSGTNSARSSPQRGNPVPQIPAEYDDLYMQSGPYADQRNFSHDINKRMKMPNRLSVDGHNLHDLEVENMRANSSTTQMAAAGMAIPEKITLSGSGQRDVMEDQYGFLNSVGGHDKQGYVNITTPPRVLTVDERFPIIETESEQPRGNGGVNEETANKIRALDLELSPQKLASNSRQDYSLVESHEVETQQRLAELERQEKWRQNKEMVLYPLIAVYFTYKIFKWLMNSSG